MSANARYPCPACGFIVFTEPAGSYSICPVCHWEDDHVQLANPIMGGGANRESLYVFQSRVLKEIPLSIENIEDFKRDPKWRPLRPKDIPSSAQAPQDGLEYFLQASEVSCGYYWEQDDV